MAAFLKIASIRQGVIFPAELVDQDNQVLASGRAYLATPQAGSFELKAGEKLDSSAIASANVRLVGLGLIRVAKLHPCQTCDCGTLHFEVSKE